MKLYHSLSQIKFLKKNYAFKFLFVTFLGIHIPLIGILFYVLFAKQSATPIMILTLALLLTLLATGITLFVLKKLIFPIRLASNALNNYRKTRVVPLLPTEYKDEVGMMIQDLLETIQENEKYINEKQDLMYLLSHDLRTFTGNSQALSKLIIEGEPTSSSKEYAELIYQSTSQQLHFIESFIKLIKAQDEISKGAPEWQTISMKAIGLNVFEQVQQQLMLKNITIQTDFEVSEVKLLVSEDLLIRVLVNLVDNAIKFSFPNSEIKLNCTQNKDRLYITIVDNGLGFESKHQDELFKKFTKYKKTGTVNESSTGIGLYLCKAIVEKYEGRLLAESKGLNQGATFTAVFETF